MLKRVKLVNFLSYEEEEVVFLDAATTVVVIGDNGHGKSALFEAVYYALFGKGRDDVKGLVRENSNGNMSVAVEITDGEDVYSIERGVKDWNKGYVKIFLNGELEERGAKVASYVQQWLGFDATTFLLVAFFGLSANDDLMKVRPSVRLETTQKIANVYIYKTFHKNVQVRKSVCRREIDSERLAVEELLPFSNSSSAESALVATKKELVKVTKRLGELSSQQSEVAAEMDRMNAFIRERDKLQVERKRMRERVAEVNEDLAETEASIAEAQDEAVKQTKEKKRLSAYLAKIDRSVLEKEARATVKSIGELEGSISLRRIAIKEEVSEGAKTKCPLCGNSVDSHSREQWKKEISTLEERLKGASLQSNFLRDQLIELDRASVLLVRVKLALQTESESLISEKAVRAKSVTKKVQLSSQLEKMDARFVKLSGTLASLESSISEYDVLQQRVSALQEKMGGCKQKVEGLKKDIQAALAVSRQIVQKKRLLKKAKASLQALSLLEEAFSRYGIPIGLLRGLCASIEEKATRIYSQFDAGHILIEDVEDRGKPGIEYFLRNQTGKRSYDQLSEGQKVMMFISVRLAIARIMSQEAGAKVPFLMLDEVTSHLSANRRDDLVKLISKVLRKAFPQVFMVSHAEVRNIFSTRLFIEMRDGISKITVR